MPFKDQKKKTRIALIYPSTKKVGNSNLGLRKVFADLCLFKEIHCEILFLEEPAFRFQPEKYEIIAFSVSYEVDILKIINFFQRLKWFDTNVKLKEGLPLLISGGYAITSNPYPYLELFDLLFIGEIEAVDEEFYLQLIKLKSQNKKKILGGLKDLPGLLLGNSARRNYSLAQKEVTRVFPDKLSLRENSMELTWEGSHFNELDLIEITRGCKRGCRFCGPGFIYRPYRELKLSEFKEKISTSQADSLGLIGPLATDNSDLTELNLLAKNKNIRLMYSSLFPGKEEMKDISFENQKTLTFSIETGSFELQKRIGKIIDLTQILDLLTKAVQEGVENFKFYLIYGFPLESKEDLQESLNWLKTINHHYKTLLSQKTRIGKITLSFNPFIPKPFTPMQWFGMEEIKILKEKMEFLKAGINKLDNIVPAFGNLFEYRLEAYLSVGDDKLMELLLPEVLKNRNLRELVAHLDHLCPQVLANKAPETTFPWSVIQNTVSLDFLKKEHQGYLDKKGENLCPGMDSNCIKCTVCQKYL